MASSARSRTLASGLLDLSRIQLASIRLVYSEYLGAAALCSSKRSRQFLHALLIARKISGGLAGNAKTLKPPRFKTSPHKRSSARREKTMSLGGWASPSANLGRVFQSPSGKWQAHKTTAIVSPRSLALASSTVRAVCSCQLDRLNTPRSLPRSSSLALTARTSLRRVAGIGECFNCTLSPLFPN
jgi:hypothetical protein